MLLRRLAHVFGIAESVVFYMAGQLQELPLPPSRYEVRRQLHEMRASLDRIGSMEEVYGEGGVAIRFYGGVPADRVRWVAGEGSTDVKRVPLEWLGTRSPENFLVVQASGDCLRERNIVSGTLVLIERNPGRDPYEGEIVLVRIGDDHSLKIWHEDGNWIELRDGIGTVIARFSRLDEYNEFEVVGIHRVSWNVSETRDGERT